MLYLKRNKKVAVIKTVFVLVTKVPNHSISNVYLLYFYSLLWINFSALNGTHNVLLFKNK